MARGRLLGELPPRGLHRKATLCHRTGRLVTCVARRVVHKGWDEAGAMNRKVTVTGTSRLARVDVCYGKTRKDKHGRESPCS